MQDVLNAFEVAENKTRMEEVKDAAGNDMMKMMQIVFPVVTQIQQEVIAKYGFTTDGEGKVLGTIDNQKGVLKREKNALTSIPSSGFSRLV